MLSPGSCLLVAHSWGYRTVSWDLQTGGLVSDIKGNSVRATLHPDAPAALKSTVDSHLSSRNFLNHLFTLICSFPRLTLYLCFFILALCL